MTTFGRNVNNSVKMPTQMQRQRPNRRVKQNIQNTRRFPGQKIKIKTREVSSRVRCWVITRYKKRTAGSYREFGIVGVSVAHGADDPHTPRPARDLLELRRRLSAHAQEPLPHQLRPRFHNRRRRHGPSGTQREPKTPRKLQRRRPTDRTFTTGELVNRTKEKKKKKRKK